MSTEIQEPKVVKGPLAAVATFVKPDGKRIYVFTKRGEAVAGAIARVMQRHGVKGGAYDLIKN